MSGDTVFGNATDSVLAAGLAELTAPAAGGGDAAVWRRAVDRFERERDAARDSTPRLRVPFWNRPVPRALRTFGVAAVLVLMAGVFALPSLGESRMSVGSPARGVVTDRPEAEKMVAGDTVRGFAGTPVYRYADADGDGMYERTWFGLRDAAAGYQHQAPAFDFSSVRDAMPNGLSASAPPPDELPPVRYVVRRATMQLETDDVRAAFTLAQQLVSPARGEYVQAADIRERDEGYEADLVLRVEAGRLDAVLIELRGLGEVLSDRIDTDDVSDRVVDLEARLRNERSVETELLALLSDREDDDLEDVLNVRRELAKVRQQIEVMVAQRNEIARLVSLATITVVLREPAPEPEPEPELASGWELFYEDLGDAFGDGVRSLGDTATGLVRLAVGGLVWWVALGIAVLLAWRTWRSSNPAALPE